MKVFWGDLDCGLGTKGLHSDPADKTFLDLCIVSNFLKRSNLLLKMGSCTIVFLPKITCAHLELKETKNITHFLLLKAHSH